MYHAFHAGPNHLHTLLHPTDPDKLLNHLVGEGKRFIAYAIIKQLKQLEKFNTLGLLAEGVQINEKKKGKKHQVFRLSFDARKCYNRHMLEQKLDYIHHNPVKGKWQLVGDFREYSHSSAAFYELGRDNSYLTHYREVS